MENLDTLKSALKPAFNAMLFDGDSLADAKALTDEAKAMQAATKESAGNDFIRTSLAIMLAIGNADAGKAIVKAEVGYETQSDNAKALCRMGYKVAADLFAVRSDIESDTLDSVLSGETLARTALAEVQTPRKAEEKAKREADKAAEAERVEAERLELEEYRDGTRVHSSMQVLTAAESGVHFAAWLAKVAPAKVTPAEMDCIESVRDAFAAFDAKVAKLASKAA